MKKMQITRASATRSDIDLSILPRRRVSGTGRSIVMGACLPPLGGRRGAVIAPVAEVPPHLR
jgi:hypothetical protein